MVRTARQKSETGLYHIMMRGTGRQIIFESKQDRDYFLETLSRKIDGTLIEIHAYCLMDNHIHLLVFDPKDELERFIRRIATAYATHFNNKYGHTGHVFQGRFQSEVILDERYYFTVLRYIIQNPLKAGLDFAKVEEWTNFKAYFNNHAHFARLVNVEKAIDAAGGADNLATFLLETNDDVCLESIAHRHFSDEKLREEIQRIGQVDSPLQIKALPKNMRDHILAQLIELEVSERKLERETGVSRSVIRRIRRDKYASR